ncbi:hypothetical protein H2199_009054 [Coniosporium tulheliwenetii]|uniref:Uncharacterized protein n=1 Tax=Coniosporium tulheliwenetii TaxID=3383036 RepID=A0ACC2YGA3_9PEZI|nr:hypothetical protein H2199_009054 [Cladosporium sp. JES 115]
MAMPDWPSTGNRPLSLNEHAAQLKTQATKLLEAAGEQKRAFRYQAAAPSIQSTIELCNKVFDQPMPAELKAMLQTVLQTANNIKQDTAKINYRQRLNASTPPALRSTATWARVASMQAGVPPQAQTISSSSSATEKDRETIVKITDPHMSSHLRSHDPKKLKDRINNALKEHANANIKKIRIVAAKQLRSGDIAIYTATGEEREALQEFAEDWAGIWGNKAQVVVQTYGVLVHRVSTRSIDLSDMAGAIRLLQAENRPLLPRAEIKYIGWLTKASTNKKNSSLVVEFARPEDANAAIIGGIVWQAEMLTCELVKHRKRAATAPVSTTPEAASKEKMPGRKGNARRARTTHGMEHDMPAEEEGKERVEQAKALRPFLHPVRNPMGSSGSTRGSAQSETNNRVRPNHTNTEHDSRINLPIQPREPTRNRGYTRGTPSEEAGKTKVTNEEGNHGAGRGRQIEQDRWVIQGQPRRPREGDSA